MLFLAVHEYLVLPILEGSVHEPDDIYLKSRWPPTMSTVCARGRKKLLIEWL